MVFENLQANAAAARDILPPSIAKIPLEPDWPEHRSLDAALVTPKNLWPAETLEKLRPILGRLRGSEECELRVRRGQFPRRPAPPPSSPGAVLRRSRSSQSRPRGRPSASNSEDAIVVSVFSPVAAPWPTNQPACRAARG